MLLILKNTLFILGGLLFFDFGVLVDWAAEAFCMLRGFWRRRLPVLFWN